MIGKVRAFLKSDKKSTIRNMSEEVRISIGSCHAIVTEDQGMR